MAYDTTSVRRSKLPYRVLKEICLKETSQGYKLREEGNYSSNIARELDTDQSLVSEIITQLQELGLVFKAERKRAQYYKIEPGGLANFVVDNILQEITEASIAEDQVKLHLTDHNSIDEMIDSLFEYKKELSQNLDSDDSKKLAAFIFYFTVYYFHNYEESTIDEMLLRNLPSGIKSKSPDFVFYDWYSWLYEISILFRGIRDPGYIVSKAFGELETQGMINISEDAIDEISSLMDSIDEPGKEPDSLDMENISGDKEKD